MQTLWVVDTLTDEQKEQCKSLEKDLNISQVESAMLVKRHIFTHADYIKFISPSLTDLYNPFLMKDMERAVERLKQAVDKHENILIYGDYDVDGTTSVALVYRFLSKIINLESLFFYIPDRHKEGYGVSKLGIDYAIETHCTLIISLDCGIKANESIAYSVKNNIDFIVCDHHMPDVELPSAVAVLDPKRNDCNYPYKELSGCGVGFKLLQAYTQKYGSEEISAHLYKQLELLAMSIASDIVPLTGENRILAYHGMKQINTSPSAGVKAILKVAGLESTSVNISDLVYKIGPRINASGRISSGKTAVELLIAKDIESASRHSESINQYNEQRKGYDHQTTIEALEQLRQDPENDNKKATVVCGEQWQQGVVGIVASRLTETYYRPTIVLTRGDDLSTYVGSARSVGGFDIYSAIESCRDLLTNFGGHVFAAGLAMKRENLSAFKSRFEQYVALHITAEQQVKTIHIENELHLSDITSDFYKFLCSLEPFGPENPTPLFATNSVRNYRYSRCVGKDNKHLKLNVTDGTSTADGIAFGKGEVYIQPLLEGESFDICYRIDENVFRDRSSLQLMVEDMKLHTDSEN